jgi:hypothetical protein
MNELRFSTRKEPDAVRFELAGKLAGEDVESLHQVWQREALTDGLKPLIIDITFITEADQYGRALLAIMHRFGAQVIADSPESSAIAQPIVTEPIATTLSKPGWFRRVIRLLTEDRRPTYPARAEMISLTSHRIEGFENRGFADLKEA